MIATEQAQLRKTIELGSALKQLTVNPNYEKVCEYLFETKPRDLVKALSMTELGSKEHVQIVRVLDALSVVNSLLDEIPTLVDNAQDNLNQLSTETE